MIVTEVILIIIGIFSICLSFFIKSRNRHCQYKKAICRTDNGSSGNEKRTGYFGDRRISESEKQ